ncbi:hypothetical protein EJ02DRAFT_437231 [Clathrospora elynae]|uniref:INO80 complex subunit F domain-containing protein n=1 Tax=Clathrospora elynae TaxID=706981 RepID=A0A6A5SIF3_9PLEO|nr:hypothetical protein EJ02DRAFT_437231 [Clathrospora elynae]
MPQPPSRAVSSKDLPPSVETAYYRKCIDLRRRIHDIEDNNDGTRQRITRLNRGIQKMRLERAFLLEQLNKHMAYNVDDSDRSSSPPPTPTDKPLRSKRSHNRKGTPPAGGERMGENMGMGMSMGEHRMGATGGMQHGGMNPMSSAQSTPDPTRQQPSYFNNTATSPHAVNGAPTLPPLQSLPPLQQQQQQQQAPPQRTYFDPAYDNERPTPVDADVEVGRRRAYSGAQPPSQTESAPPPPQNGDTEMADAGFTAVNNR